MARFNSSSRVINPQILPVSIAHTVITGLSLPRDPFFADTSGVSEWRSLLHFYSSWKISIESVISHLIKFPTSNGPFAGEYISSLSGDFTRGRSFHLKGKLLSLFVSHFVWGGTSQSFLSLQMKRNFGLKTPFEITKFYSISYGNGSCLPNNVL